MNDGHPVLPVPTDPVARAAFDHLPATPHASDLYEAQGVVEALPDLAAIDAAQVTRYREQGYLAVTRAFSPEEVEAARTGLSDLIMGRRPEFQGIQFESWARQRLPQMALEERETAVRKLMWFVGREPRLAHLAQAPPLLEVIRRLLDGREPRLFQDMALLKPPGGREKPWHQDHAYFDYPLGTPIVGVWIALDDATAANGCMRLRPGSHRAGAVPHFERRDWQICDTTGRDLPVLAAPLPAGGLLLFDGLLQHGTPYNPTALRRRAVQFHYAPADAPVTSTRDRLALFGGEGMKVEC